METTPKKLDEYFTDEAIIKTLCTIRIRRAKNRHDALFYRRLSKQAKRPQDRELFDAHFPPRRQWHKYRSRYRTGASGTDVSRKALQRAVFKLRHSKPNYPWAELLDSLVERIRTKALAKKGHAFSTPKISSQHKSGSEYRPIASFEEVEDRVIDSLVGRYLRELFDHAFEPCSVAYRADLAEPRPPDRDAAIAQIIDFRRKYSDRPLYVAECDIRGFFDCVAHPVAKRALQRILQIAAARRPGLKIDSRARGSFNNYLACYSFPGTVKAEEPSLRKKVNDEQAFFKWPAKDSNSLKDYYDDPFTRTDIGVPQGGAISCLISNLILDLADKEVALSAQRSGDDLLYFRYSDDMVLISPSERACRNAFETYTGALRVLKLPYHPPIPWVFYGKNYYNESKTKAPYVWHGRKWLNQAPWIQFLGYQIRYDGLLRIRKSSIDKHKKRLREIRTKVAKNTTGGNSRVNRQRLLYRTHQKLIAVSVGRVDPGRSSPTPHSGPLQMCWAAGFKALHGRPFVGHPLRMFDSLRATQKHLLGLEMMKRPLPNRKPSNLKGKMLKFHGYPFSYDAQFNNAGGNDLIRNPYQPSICERLCVIPLYLWAEKRAGKAPRK